VERGEGTVLSFSQDDLVLHHPVDPDDPYHNVLTAIELTGALDEGALCSALDRIVARHEALRTRIVEGPTGWVQRIEPSGTWPLTTVDLRETDEAATETGVTRVLGGLERYSFDLGQEPMVRGALIRTSADRTVLALVMHHLVTDNWSYGVLFRELRELYAAQVLGREPELPSLPVQYPDFAAWQKRQLATGALEEHLEYWRDRLRDLPPTPTFTAPAHQASREATGATCGFRVDAATAKALAGVGRQQGATLFMVLMAAYEVLLSAYADTDDVVASR
jgi:NRPS condensation-like uncharacterized protein